MLVISLVLLFIICHESAGFKFKLNCRAKHDIKLKALQPYLIKPVIVSLLSFGLLTFSPSLSLKASNAEVLTTSIAIQDIEGSQRLTKIKLPSGVEYQDAVVGTGDSLVKEGSSVQFQWVLRRSNGYFVDASSNYGDEPFIYKVGNTKKVIKGLDEAIRGMKVGGIRRINIPPKMAFTEGVGDDKPGPMPDGN